MENPKESTDKGQQLKERAQRFLRLFAIGCFMMMVIRLIMVQSINPLVDPGTKSALLIGLLSYGLYLGVKHGRFLS